MRNHRQLLNSCIKKAAEAMLIYGVTVATSSIMRVVQVGNSNVNAPSYRVRVIFNATGVSDSTVDRLFAYFLSDMNHMISRFRLNVSSVYIDYINGKPYENPKGD